MNEQLEALKQRALASFRRARVFYSSHRGLLLSGLTILSILLIVWARFGFTLQFSQFFAYQGGGGAETHLICVNNACVQRLDPNGVGDQCATNADCAAASPSPTATTTTNPTPTPTSGGVCADNTNCSVCSGVTQARKDCEGNNSTTRNGIGKNDGTEPCSWWKSYGQNFCTTCPYLYQTAKAPKGAAAGDNSVATWAAAGVSKQNLCQEKPDDCPSGWHAWSSSWCEQNSVAPPPAPAPTATPTPTATAAPSPTATATATTSPNTTPTPTATPSPTPTPTLSPTVTATTMPTTVPVTPFSLAISGRNVTTGGVQTSAVQLQAGQELEVVLTVGNLTSGANSGAATSLSNVVVRATLPAGLVYISGSTSINGVSTTIDSVATGGLALGSLVSQQQIIVAFHAKAVTSSFAVGTTQVMVPVGVTTSNAAPQTVALPVTVTRAAAAIPGAVKTGPGDAVLVALLMSAIMTLLYVSYTHTSAYKRREIDAITKDRDPLDFRS